MRTPYWNPRTETLPREQLDQLRLRKLRDHVAWTLGNAPWQGRLLREAGVRAEDISSLDDIRRIPFMTRDDWMESQIADPPFGEVLAQPPAAAMRYHTTSGTSGSRPLAVLDGPKDWEWIAEMWCYAPLGLRHPPQRQRVLRLQLRDLRRVLGRPLRRREARLPRAAGRQHDDRGPRAPDHGDGHDRRLLHADLRAAHGAGGPVARHRPRQRPRPARLLSGEPAGSIPATKQLIEEQWARRRPTRRA